MENKEQSSAVCKSVFKNGKDTTTTNQLTQKWIEMINRIERNKSISTKP